MSIKPFQSRKQHCGLKKTLHVGQKCPIKRFRLKLKTEPRPAYAISVFNGLIAKSGDVVNLYDNFILIFMEAKLKILVNDLTQVKPFCWYFFYNRHEMNTQFMTATVTTTLTGKEWEDVFPNKRNYKFLPHFVKVKMKLPRFEYNWLFLNTLDFIKHLGLEEYSNRKGQLEREKKEKVFHSIDLIYGPKVPEK